MDGRRANANVVSSKFQIENVLATAVQNHSDLMIFQPFAET